MEEEDDVKNIEEEPDDSVEPGFVEALLTDDGVKGNPNSSKLCSQGLQSLSMHANNPNLDRSAKTTAQVPGTSDFKPDFDGTDDRRSSSQDAQLNLNFSFAKRDITKSHQNTTNEKDASNRTSFKRSPSFGKRTKYSSDSQKRNEKMYLSDEDGVGDDVFGFHREEDERNYSSETELDVAWNQSESIEADQYKMDPEADQMKDEGADGSSALASEANFEIPSEDDSEGGGRAANHEMRIATNLTNPQCDSSISSAISSSFVNDHFSATKPHNQEHLPCFPSNDLKKHPLHHNHLVVGDQVAGDSDAIFPSTIPSTKERSSVLEPKSDSLSSSSVVGSIIGMTKPVNPALKDQKLSEDLGNVKVNQEVNSHKKFEVNDWKAEIRKFSLAQHHFAVPVDQVAWPAAPRNPDDAFGSAFSKDVHEAAEAEHQLRLLLTLSDKHLPERAFFSEVAVPDETKIGETAESGVAFDAIREREKILSKFKESLPLSFCHLVEPYLRGDVAEQSMSKSNATNFLADSEMLRASLDEQTFRRKHCEKQVLLLQKRVAELQQTLAVAVSLDRMKDDTIKGVDKVLAKSVEGWKRKEEESRSLMERMAAENASMKEIIQKQQDVLLKFESENSELHEKLKKEKETHDLECKENAKKVQHLQGCLERSETQKCDELNSLLKKLDAESKSKMKVEGELQQRISSIQASHEQELTCWRSKEAELRGEVRASQKKCTERVELEKMRSDKLQNIIEELNVNVKHLQKEDGRLRDEIARLNQEKECLESASKVKEEKHGEEMRELRDEFSVKTRNEVAEVTRRLVELHKRDVERLVEMHSEEVGASKKDYERRYGELMASLSQVVEETRRLKEENEGLKNYKKNIASKIQLMLQVHCQEALRLFDIEASGRNVDDARSSQQTLHRIPPAKPLSGDLDGGSKLSKKFERGEVSGEVQNLTLLPPALSPHQLLLGSDQRSAGIQSRDHKPVVDKRLNKKSRSLRNIPGSADHFPQAQAECTSTLSELLEVSPVYAAANFKDVKNTPPIRLAGQSRDPPTTDRKFSELSLMDRIDQHTSNDLERSHILRHYIKMMLHQSPGIFLREDGDEVDTK